MSYDISFRVKVEGLDDYYIDTGYCEANVTYNLRKMIEESTGLEWKNESNNGLCSEVIPKIIDGLSNITRYPDAYKQYESPNGWGTINGCINFFTSIIEAWSKLRTFSPELAKVAVFWIG